MLSNVPMLSLSMRRPRARRLLCRFDGAIPPLAAAAAEEEEAAEAAPRMLFGSFSRRSTGFWLFVLSFEVSASESTAWKGGRGEEEEEVPFGMEVEEADCFGSSSRSLCNSSSMSLIFRL